MTLDNAITMMLDEDNPWPALCPFDETCKDFFHGRDEETANLRRAVFHAALTILYGQSGLGKTSLLRAGLFPSLHDDDILPIYIRLDVQDTKRPLIEQLKTAMVTKLKELGIEAPSCNADETLWEYLHRINIEFWTSKNRLITPLFVLDQFEEIFTLGINNLPAVAQLRIDLTDLVENRIPASISAATDEDKSNTSALLNFQRQNYKVLISFREDFLPSVEGWKREMPSILRNRFRLTQMNGKQAYDAIHKTAPKLVDDTIAKEIIRFLAGVQSSANPNEIEQQTTAPTQDRSDTVSQTDLEELTVEPALLSLFCHGLNEQRKQRKMLTFDHTLLAGMGNTIIEDFYHKCLDGLGDNVHRFIENELITKAGYRKPCSEEVATSNYSVTDYELKTMVNRWLIRKEPFHGTNFVELIHDVLAPVVNMRREERQQINLLQQKDIEIQHFRKKQHKRLLISTGSVLLLLLISIIVSYLAFTANNRLDLMQVSMSLRRAAVTGNQQEIERIIKASKIVSINNNITIKLKATKFVNHNMPYTECFKYSMYPDLKSLPDKANIAIITYFATNCLTAPYIATGPEDFKAEYDGSTCTEIFALIEYNDVKIQPVIARLNQCEEMKEIRSKQ